MIWRCETSIHKPEWDNYPVDQVYDPLLRVKGICRKCNEISVQGMMKILYESKTLEEVEKELLNG